MSACVFKRNAFNDRRRQRVTSSGSLRGLRRSDENVGTKGAEFSSDATLGVDLKIEECGGYGRSRAKGEQDNEQTPTIGAEQTANDAPEHGSIAAARRAHHSPRRIGAGS